MYHIKRIEGREQIEQCERFSLGHYMWDSRREPVVYGWLGYLEKEGIYVKMVCEEADPLCVYRDHGAPVYEDSAMEIFLAFPEEGQTDHCIYTNFEINANGAMRAQYGWDRWNRTFLTREQLAMTGVKAVVEQNRWYVEVLFPEAYLNEICSFEEIKKGGSFRCNFYKICEKEGFEHFGSYSLIESETPDFHLPVYFAEAVLVSSEK